MSALPLYNHNNVETTSPRETFIPFASLSFSEENCVGHIPSHASEVIEIDGKLYITHCGWGQGGVYLAPLEFLED